MLGVMLVSMFLSMWVDNTGATAMILPVVDALVQELFRVRDFQFTLEHLELKKGTSFCNKDDEEIAPEQNNERPVDLEKSQDLKKGSQNMDVRSRNIRTYLLLSVAFAANLGGSGT